MPLYIIWALFHLTVTCVNNRFVPDFWDVFGILTTLSYWGGGTLGQTGTLVLQFVFI